MFRDHIAHGDHRDKDGDPRAPVCVAKDTPICEAKQIPKAQAALEPEWKQAMGHEVMDPRICDGAQRSTEGRVVQRKDIAFRSGVPAMHGTAQRESIRGSVAFEQSSVSDQNSIVVIFEELASSSASLMSASQMIDVTGCQQGWTIQQYDAQQADPQTAS